eukprot:380889_1
MRNPNFTVMLALWTVASTWWACDVSCLSHTERAEASDLAREMFLHGFNNYMDNAFPEDELLPLSCSGRRSYGDYSLTLLDSLDALVVFGEAEQFKESVRWISHHLNFDVDINVSVFETNIRLLGALLSAHLLALPSSPAGDEFVVPEYDGELAGLAVDLGERMLKAFDTETGLPFGTVNLRHGVPEGETSIVCTACAGSFMLEFGYLSRISGRPEFEHAARRATRALFDRRMGGGMYGTHICSKTGAWMDTEYSVGNYIDSYFEYLLKSYIAFGYEDSWEMFEVTVEDAFNNLYSGDGWWPSKVGGDKFGYEDSWEMFEVTVEDAFNNLYSGDGWWPSKVGGDKFDTFAGYWAGVLALSGELGAAEEFTENLMSIQDELEFIPELYNFREREVVNGREGYPLRPEYAEALFYAFTSTGSELYEKAALKLLRSINEHCRTECGFAALSSVQSKQKEDLMDSFFLSETLKYLYLIFADNHWAVTDNVIFNTEAHIFSITQLNKIQLYKEYERENITDSDFATLLVDFYERALTDPTVNANELSARGVRKWLRLWAESAPSGRHRLNGRVLS